MIQSESTFWFGLHVSYSAWNDESNYFCQMVTQRKALNHNECICIDRYVYMHIYAHIYKYIIHIYYIVINMWWIDWFIYDYMFWWFIYDCFIYDVLYIYIYYTYMFYIIYITNIYQNYNDLI